MPSSSAQSQQTSGEGVSCPLTLPVCEAAQPLQSPAVLGSGGQAVFSADKCRHFQVCHVFLVTVGRGCVGTVRAHSLGLPAYVALPALVSARPHSGPQLRASPPQATPPGPPCALDPPPCTPTLGEIHSGKGAGGQTVSGHERCGSRHLGSSLWRCSGTPGFSPLSLTGKSPFSPRLPLPSATRQQGSLWATGPRSHEQSISGFTGRRRQPAAWAWGPVP